MLFGLKMEEQENLNESCEIGIAVDANKEDKKAQKDHESSEGNRSNDDAHSNEGKADELICNELRIFQQTQSIEEFYEVQSEFMFSDEKSSSYVSREKVKFSSVSEFIKFIIKLIES